MKRASIRVVIADDHAIFRAGLRKLLESEPGVEVCAEVEDASGAVTAVTDQHPELLLLDMAMPHASGLETLRLLADYPAPTRAIVLTAGIGPPEIVQALQLGARGVVLKTAASDVLFRSIRTVLDDQFWIEWAPFPDQESSLRHALQRDREQLDFDLTPREQDVIQALVDGLTNRDIAEQLGIQEVTVKRHFASIFDKCGLSNRVELTLFALRHGLARL